MARDVDKFLEDVRQAGLRIQIFCASKSFDAYQQNEMLRSAVERQFLIIGEALNRIKQIDHALFARIPDAARIIALRNILVHGYDVVDDHIVWDIVEFKLHPLLAVVEAEISPH